MSDTIAAIATGNVLSAIGILRLSGDGVLTVIDRVFRPANGRPMSEAPDRKLVYGAFCDTDGQTLDLCLCTVSRAPHSYTGEDTKFNDDDMKLMPERLETAAEIIKSFCLAGLNITMNQFNNK